VLRIGSHRLDSRKFLSAWATPSRAATFPSTSLRGDYWGLLGGDHSAQTMGVRRVSWIAYRLQNVWAKSSAVLAGVPKGIKRLSTTVPSSVHAKPNAEATMLSPWLLSWMLSSKRDLFIVSLSHLPALRSYEL
jgi:hypothetical protein